jgi:uncharacterized glyoxalase superfamily protein PhnB
VISNRSVPAASVIPQLPYPDVAEASQWLCAAFGFAERLRIGSHRIQLVYGEGAMIAIERAGAHAPDGSRSSLLVRVEDADAHHEQASAHGALIVNPPADHPYGERQYTAEDPGGHHWTFSESIADVDPASWGGTLITPDT